MKTIGRQETIQLDTGGWIDLHGCQVLYTHRPGLFFRRGGLDVGSGELLGRKA